MWYSPWLWFLRVWFDTRPDDFLYFVKHFLTSGSKGVKQAVGEVNRTKVKHVISDIPPTDFMTYMKDRLNMSTHMMTELRLWPGLDDILPKIRTGRYCQADCKSEQIPLQSKTI